MPSGSVNLVSRPIHEEHKIGTVENPFPRAGHEGKLTGLTSSDTFSDPAFHPSSELIRERADLCFVNLKNRESVRGICVRDQYRGYRHRGVMRAAARG